MANVVNAAPRPMRSYARPLDGGIEEELTVRIRDAIAAANNLLLIQERTRSRLYRGEVNEHELSQHLEATPTCEDLTRLMGSISRVITCQRIFEMFRNRRHIPRTLTSSLNVRGQERTRRYSI